MYDPITLKLSVDPLVLSALKEDVTSEDVTTNAVMPTAQAGEVDLVCKEDGVICGLQVFRRAFELLDENTEFEFYVQLSEFFRAGVFCVYRRFFQKLCPLFGKAKSRLYYPAKRGGTTAFRQKGGEHHDT